MSLVPVVDQISFSQAQKEVTHNQAINAEAPAAVYGIKTLIGLSLVLYGGTIDVAGTPTVIADQTVSLTNGATNYVKASSAGVVSVVTSAPSGWPGPLASGVTALYTIVTSGGVYVPASSFQWRIAIGSGSGSSAMTVLSPAYATPLTIDLTGITVPLVVVNVGTLTGPITFNITNGTDGQIIRTWFTQDGPGSRIFTAGANLRFSTDTPSPTLSTTGGKIDVLGWQWRSVDSKAWLLAVNKGY